MKQLVADIKKLPDSEKVVYFFDKNGVRQEKTVKVTDRWLVVNARGDSFASTRKELAKLGINVDIANKKVTEDVEDFDEDEDPTQNVTQSSPNSNNGENKNG